MQEESQLTSLLFQTWRAYVENIVKERGLVIEIAYVQKCCEKRQALSAWKIALKSSRAKREYEERQKQFFRKLVFVNYKYIALKYFRIIKEFKQVKARETRFQLAQFRSIASVALKKWKKYLERLKNVRYIAQKNRITMKCMLLNTMKSVVIVQQNRRKSIEALNTILQRHLKRGSMNVWKNQLEFMKKKEKEKSITSKEQQILAWMDAQKNQEPVRVQPKRRDLNSSLNTSRTIDNGNYLNTTNMHSMRNTFSEAKLPIITEIEEGNIKQQQSQYPPVVYVPPTESFSSRSMLQEKEQLEAAQQQQQQQQQMAALIQEVRIQIENNNREIEEKVTEYSDLKAIKLADESGILVYLKQLKVDLKQLMEENNQLKIYLTSLLSNPQ